MKIEINLGGQELRGRQAVKLEVYDSNDKNVGAFIVGKGGIRWQEPRARKSKSKSWNETIKWLREHGRTVTQ